MRKKIMAFVFAAALALALAVPLFGAGTAAADPGHTSCAQGAKTAVDIGAATGGPGEGPSGAAVSAAASDGVGNGVSEEINDIKNLVCAP